MSEALVFELRPSPERCFDSLDEVLGFCSEERIQIARIPLRNLWTCGARIITDSHLQFGSSSYSFSPSAFSALCKVAAVSEQLLLNLNSRGLSSKVLNDRLEQYVGSSELVVDEEQGVAIGVVSEHYVTCSNDDFLRGLLVCMDPGNESALFPDLSDFRFQEAYSSNSHLTIRFGSRTVHGVVTGRGGSGDDVSEIGIEASNTMAGGHSAKISWFVFRLICANGLVLPVSGSKGRIFHSGTQVSFQKRLIASVKSTFSGMNKAKVLIERLGGIPFNSLSLARYADHEALFSIVPGRNLRDQALGRTSKKDYRNFPKPEMELRRVSDAIAEIPYCFNGTEANEVFRSPWRDGASMYDFLNVFTEYAKALAPTEKIEVQKRAGKFGAWIAKNRRKFL